MHIPNCLSRAFKLGFWLNVILTVIMLILLCMNFAKIPDLPNSGPLAVFVIDIISNGVWLLSAIMSVCAFFKASFVFTTIHIFGMTVVWFLKVAEIILTAVLIQDTKDEAFLTFGGKTSTIIGVAIDICIIIPITLVGFYSRRYLLLKNESKQF